jgi:hypothetical protein
LLHCGFDFVTGDWLSYCGVAGPDNSSVIEFASPITCASVRRMFLCSLVE